MQKKLIIIISSVAIIGFLVFQLVSLSVQISNEANILAQESLLIANQQQMFLQVAPVVNNQGQLISQIVKFLNQQHK